MRFTRNLPVQTRRDAWVEVNLGALEKNARRIRATFLPEVSLMAILKADAYGHGSVMCIPTLEASGVSMVGVAAMDEAIAIRQAGLEIPVLVIGAIPDWAMAVAAEYDVQLTIFDEHHLDSLQKAFEQTRQPVKVHIKVDTGMRRIGIDWQQAVSFIEKCQNADFIEVTGIFSHLSCAEDPAFSEVQQQRFQQVLDNLPRPWPQWVHLANTLGSFCYPLCRYNLIRPGIGFFGYYGYSPSDTDPKLQNYALPKLTPVMGLKGRIVHLQGVPAQEGISYGHRHRTTQPSLIATLPMGYADGIPRGLSGKMEGLIQGVRVPQVGTITMDQLMFDVSSVPNVSVGETITLLGREGSNEITLSDWSRHTGTIEYEMMCALRVRLPKTYTRD